jgi:hypothetical protein
MHPRGAMSIDDMVLGPDGNGDSDMCLQRATATYTCKVGQQHPAIQVSCTAEHVTCMRSSVLKDLTFHAANHTG